ncbi:allergen Tab y 5.0101 [Drosophila pseudoobscura]|uniref:Allergen Tab y 5.0101 n=1 Tax=Drosophila pseudoobscura pseudoobscura TaxID=46245 RepID=A0A6I8V4V9_DROPS|nr:allergen Tab y 5.0101 [Drosophila pseudoobscura]
MKICSSILWYAAGLLFLCALNEVRAQKKPKYCSRAKPPSKTKSDYCSLPSCGGAEHIGCNSNKQFIEGCVGNMFNVSQNMRNFIVKQHNIYRNIVARGKLHGLPPSGRMLKMQWHEELAEVARFAAYRCSIGPVHKCHTTLEYAGTGYNMAYNKFPSAQDPTKIVRAQLKAWYEQYQYANTQSMISGTSPAGQEIGHFLQLVSGLADRVGCAIFSAKHFSYNYQTLVCAYSCSYKKNLPAYKIARIPAEDCTCGSDQDFKNLCSGFERVRSCEHDAPMGSHISPDAKLIGVDYDNLLNANLNPKPTPSENLWQGRG